MLYYNQDKFGLTFDDVRRLYPEISFPANIPLTTGPVYSYKPTPTPNYDPIRYYVVEVRPVNGQQVWEVRALSPDQVAENVKAQRRRLQTSIVEQTQARLDDFARTRSYDGILSACTYATSSVPKFQAEGQYCVVARDETWATLYTILAEVEAGVYPMPTSFADIEPELPALVWP